MKATKIIFNIILACAVVLLAWLCIDSVVTPIKFEETRAERETEVIKKLVQLRTAEAEFKLVKGHYTADLDSLVLFLRTAPKKELLKEGALTDKQLENGMTEAKAAKIMKEAKDRAKVRLKTDNDSVLYAYVWNNDREVKNQGLQGFRRDTIYKNMIETLYKGEYTADNIDQITFIPYTDNLRFEVETDNNYATSQGIKIPIMEARAPFNTYLSDLDKQELVNLIDKEEKLEHYAGLKFGSIEAPNNNAGNWE
jgi:uncharacterized protein YpmB